MSVRLEQALDSLRDRLSPEHQESARNLVNEAFYEKAVPELRKQLGIVLKDRKRVAVFVDNLDKGWQKGANFELLAKLILGLMTARGQVTTDFTRSDHYRSAVNVTVSVFLRSDIWMYVKAAAREQDKLPISEVVWRDPEVLLGVLETRFEVTVSDSAGPAELWTKYFNTPFHGIAERITYRRSFSLARATQ